MIQKLANIIPLELVSRSGSVFYSGREAFEDRRSLYILGINPGGDPVAQAHETIERHTKRILEQEPGNWSAYRDESWRGSPPGTNGMQPRVLHLLDRLGLNPGLTPASNLIFVRSRREADIKSKFDALVNLCWPVHALAIEFLQPKLVVCFGLTAGAHVCSKLDANIQIGEFIEKNNRRWKSRVFSSKSGIRVGVLTHPSIVNWTNPDSDPSPLLLDVL